MKFLKRFSIALRKLFRIVSALRWGGAQYVRRSGDVARFVFSDRHLSKDGKPKRGAFQPERHPKLGRWEVSVCGLYRVSAVRVWELGSTIRAEKSAIAALRLPVAAIVSIGLECEAAPELPDFAEHGVIVGWDPEDDSKESRNALQLELAARVTATMRPVP